MSLKERFIIPKRKESQQESNHHHHHHHYHHHHHSSKHSQEHRSSRLNFDPHVSTSQHKPIDPSVRRRSFIPRDLPRTQEQQLSKEERRKLFEQQYEDAEKVDSSSGLRTSRHLHFFFVQAKAAAAMDSSESPGRHPFLASLMIASPSRNPAGLHNEPPYKKQRTSDDAEGMTADGTPQQGQTPLMVRPSNVIDHCSIQYFQLSSHEKDQTFWIHQHLSQIPIDYIRSYMASIGKTQHPKFLFVLFSFSTRSTYFCIKSVSKFNRPS